jgi:hypothetical protein
MGLIAQLLDLLFGGNRNLVRDTAEVFRPNAEAQAAREAGLRGDALDQYAAEFRDHSGGFDRFMDGVNRIPRPAMALGTLGLFVAAMADPEWFASRMAGLAVVPEPLWWLLGVIVSFYFGARHQFKAQGFQRDLATTLARQRGDEAAPTPTSARPGIADAEPDATPPARSANPALEEWRTGGYGPATK